MPTHPDGWAAERVEKRLTVKIKALEARVAFLEQELAALKGKVQPAKPSSNRRFLVWCAGDVYEAHNAVQGPDGWLDWADTAGVPHRSQPGDWEEITVKRPSRKFAVEHK